MLILAPMQGLTERMFRRAYNQCFPGALDSSVAPFVSLTHGNCGGREQLEDILPERNEGSMPVIPQILGHELEEFVRMADCMGDFGYTEVNWNIGCPMRRIAAKHRGSGILPYPNEIREVLDYVVPRIKPRLSVKMRLGHRSADEIFDIIPILNDYPLASVTIHGRTGKQQYGGSVDKERVFRAASMLKAPFIYNGDICTASKLSAVSRRWEEISRQPLAGVMIGRGVLYDPTLPLKIKGIEGDYTEMTRQFATTLYDAIERDFPHDIPRLRKMKEYWCLVYKSLPVSESAARAMLRLQDIKDFRKAVDKAIGACTHMAIEQSNLKLESQS